MANPEKKHERNVAGPFYCTDPEDPKGEGCIACARCYTEAPAFFSSDEAGNAFVKVQPETDEEIEAANAALGICPVDSIGSNGGD